MMGAGSATQALAAVSILVVAVHVVIALGWSEAAIFAAARLAITFAIENMVTTGFPFGQHAFSLVTGMPRICLIPIVVGPVYFRMGCE